MRLRFVVTFISSFIFNMLSAQPGDLVVQGATPNLHLVHTVAPKENWYSVGRLYNISPKEVAPFNGETLDKPLSIGQQIKIPLTSSNFSQDGSKTSDEIFLPVYHVVQEKEWMFRISTNYNKVPVENLEKWNHISKDDAKAGTKLIIGYLKVKKDLSALASKGAVAVPSTSVPAPVTSAKPEQVKEEPVARAEKKEEQKTFPAEEKKKEDEPLPSSQTQQAEKPAEDTRKPVSQSAGVPAAAETNQNVNGGYFRPLYANGSKNVSGEAGIFKSTSGWQDGKYYALMNNVAVGTIVKVNNPSNNKSVYAKVLGQLPDMKESGGLTVRLSDAAAAQLQASAVKFPVQVNY